MLLALPPRWLVMSQLSGLQPSIGIGAPDPFSGEAGPFSGLIHPDLYSAVVYKRVVNGPELY